MSSLPDQTLVRVVNALTEDVSHTLFVESLSSVFSESSYPSSSPSFASSQASLGHHLLSRVALASTTSVDVSNCPYPDCTVTVPHTYIYNNENALRPDGIPSLHVQRFQPNNDPFPWVNCWKAVEDTSFKPRTGAPVYLYGFGVVHLKETRVRSGRWVVFSCKDESGMIVTRVAFRSSEGGVLSRLFGSCVSNTNFDPSV